MKTAKLRRWSKGGGGKNLPFISSASGLYSYMQQSNVPQLEGNSICAAVRNAKYISEYIVTGRKYTQCRGTCPKEFESSFPFPFTEYYRSNQLFTTGYNCLQLFRETEEGKNVKFPRRRSAITSINQGNKAIIPASIHPHNPPPLRGKL